MGGQWKCFMNTYKIGKDGKTNVLNQKKKKNLVLLSASHISCLLKYRLGKKEDKSFYELNIESSMNGIY